MTGCRFGALKDAVPGVRSQRIGAQRRATCRSREHTLIGNLANELVGIGKAIGRAASAYANIWSIKNVLAAISMTLVSDGLVVFSKRACPTCFLIESVMQRAARSVKGFQVVSQDDPAFPREVVNVVDDRGLDHSWMNNIEATPTLVRFAQGREAERVVGWDRDGWRRLTGIRDLGEGLPAFQPG